MTRDATARWEIMSQRSIELVKVSKRAYYQRRLVDSGQDSTELWNVLNEMCRKRSGSSFISEGV